MNTASLASLAGLMVLGVAALAAAEPAKKQPKRSTWAKTLPASASKDVRQAARGCDDGDAMRCVELAGAFYSGRGVVRDFAAAWKVGQRACDLHPTSERTCYGARASSQSPGPVEKAVGFHAGRPPRSQAQLDAYRRAVQCDRRDAPSCGELGSMYIEGTGVPVAIGRGAAYIAYACERGDTPMCELSRSIEATLKAGCRDKQPSACDALADMKRLRPDADKKDSPDRSQPASLGGGGTGIGTFGTGKYGRIGHGSGSGNGYGRNLGANRKVGTLRIGALRVGPTLDKVLVRRYIRKRFARIHYCFMANKSRAVTVVARFTIGLDGVVSGLKTSGGKKKVRRCIADAMTKTRFPRPKGKKVAVRLPLEFTP